MSRFINLTLLPIFNDEGIYLDWGWREISRGDLYYSLYDAKQPFLMWLFGIAELFVKDPLFAGRTVSIFFGICTVMGIYLIAQKFFTKRIALLSVLFYSIIPIFTFYDRQALMESAIGAIGVWSCYLFSLVLEKEENKYAIFLGITLGIGYFIKSSALLFFITFLCMNGWYIFRYRKLSAVKKTGIVVLSMGGINLLLLINPEFWYTLPSNSRFSLTASELMGFPVMHWLLNALANITIIFYFITPIVSLAIVLGIWIIAAGFKLLVQQMFKYF